MIARARALGLAVVVWTSALACERSRSSDDQRAAQADPWAVSPRADDLPSLADRHRIAEQACPRVTRPYFYSIEKDGHTSYLLGTRHVSVGLAKFPPIVRERLRAAKLAVFEVAPDDHARPPHHPVDLRRELGEPAWQHLGELIGSARDGFAHADISTALLQVSMIYEDPSAMLEHELEHELAGAASPIPARGLETGEFQFALLDKLLDARMLRTMIMQTKDRAKLEADARASLHDYCEGTRETGGMDDEERRDLKAGGYTDAEIDALDSAMIFDRNASWIPELESILASGDAFIAVGAGHLRGPKSVVALLRARGYTVTRIDSDHAD